MYQRIGRGLLSPLLFLLYLITLVSCSPILPHTPEKTYNVLPQPKKIESVATIPISINLDTYFNLIEQEIPKQFTGSQKSCEGVSFSYTFDRDPIQFTTSKNEITFKLTGRYSLKLNYCPKCTDLFNEQGNCISPRIYLSCGVNEPQRRVSISYSTKFIVTPSYTFNTTTQLVDFILIDPCEVSLVNYDISNELKKELTGKLESLEKEIDKSIEAFALKKELETVWNTLGQIQPIPDFGFYTLNPVGIQLSPIVFNKHTSIVNVSLAMYPAFSTELPSSNTNKLPNQTSIHEKSGFELSLDTKISYDSISSLVSAQLVKDTIKIKRHIIYFDSIQTWGSTNQLGISVYFNGSRNGILHFSGTPIFNDTNQTIEITQFDYTLETKDILLKSARWLFSSKITEKLKEYSHINLSGYLNQFKQLITSALNTEISKDILLSGACKSIILENIYLTPTHILARFLLQGNLSIKVK
jgi:hypothetical protein